MSRIAGFVGLQCDEFTKERMLATMCPRSNVDRVYYEQECCTLLYCGKNISANEQLSFLDWAGERYRIVLDGKLYNAEEILRQLKLLDHHFENATDADIILHAYAQWGNKAPEKLLGVFSFAIWHEHEKVLFLARDQMGVKPLFYDFHDGGFIFSSEIKTILSYPSVSAQINSNGISQIMLVGPGRVPGSCVFKGIYELEPGHYGVYRDKELAKCRYWGLKDREHVLSFEETAEEVRALVLDSISRQLEDTDTIGAFLSGGLDSSIISAVCAKKLQQQGRTLDTFSVDYADNDKYFVPGKFQPERDNDYIEIMRRFIRSNHHWTVLDPLDLISCMEQATCARDLPGMGDVDFSLFAFCKQIKGCVNTALSGECADELFGGYPWFNTADVGASESFPWAENTDYRALFINKAFEIDARAFVADHIRQSLGACDVLPECNRKDRQIKQITWLNQNWFMQTLIDRNDRMSMDSGLEIRTPFCDHRIAAYMYAVPWAYKHYADREKGLLRYAMEGLVPNEILWRKKSPYPKTYDPGYTKMVKDMLLTVLNDRNAPLWDIADMEAVRKLLSDELQFPWYGQLMKGPQTMAYMLQINIWMKKYNVSVV